MIDMQGLNVLEIILKLIENVLKIVMLVACGINCAWGFLF